MSPPWRVAALLLPAFVLPLSSCKPAPAEQLHYTFLFPSKDAPSDTVLMFGDLEIGRIEPAGKTGSSDDKTYAHAHGMLPRSAGPISAAPDKLKARRRTAAGEILVQLKVLDGAPLHAGKSNDHLWSAGLEEKLRKETDDRKPDVRHYFPIFVPIDWAEGMPGDAKAPSVTIIVDDHGASPPARVTIGALEVRSGDPRETQGLTPGECYPVTVDGAPLGTLEVKPRTRAYLISTKPACYTERLITYAGSNDRMGGPSGISKVHDRGTIFPLVHRPDYVLEKAPSSIRGGGTSVTAAEVVESPCP